VPFDHAAAEHALATGGQLHLGTGTGQTRILCASYHQDPRGHGAVAHPTAGVARDPTALVARRTLNTARSGREDAGLETGRH
jgi:hypothetical protein